MHLLYVSLVAAQVSCHNQVSSVNEIISSGSDQMGGRAFYRRTIEVEPPKKR